MTSWRRALNRSGGWLPAVATSTAILCLAGLGWHAAHDWHRHGSTEEGFFHLHFHVGGHHHSHPHDEPDAHWGAERHPGEDGAPDPDQSREPRETVLTILQAAPEPAPATPHVQPNGPLSGRVHAPPRPMLPPPRALDAALARGPPA
jgi:hypothetical protein